MKTRMNILQFAIGIFGFLCLYSTFSTTKDDSLCCSCPTNHISLPNSPLRNAIGEDPQIGEDIDRSSPEIHQQTIDDKQTASKREEQEVRLIDEGGSNFHIVHEGRRIEGGFLHKLNNLQLKTNMCHWCPTSASPDHLCISGEMKIGGVDASAENVLEAGAGALLKLRSFTDPTATDQSRFTYFSYYLICQLHDSVPYETTGFIKVPNLFTIKVNPRLNLESSSSSKIKPNLNYVCNGRGTFSQSAERLRVFVDFHTRVRKFDAVIVYDYGFNQGETMQDLIERNEQLMQFVLERKLIVINLEKAMQRLYGALAPEAVFFSLDFGQLISKYECFSRTKSYKANWVYFVDRDEWLTYGRNYENQEITFPAFAAKHPESNYIRFKYKWLVDEKNDVSHCKVCERGYWDEKEAYEFHKTKELTTSIYGRWDAPGQLGTYVIKVQQFDLKDLNGHVLNNGHGGIEFVVHFDDLYLRHYRKCGQVNAFCPNELVGRFSTDFYLHALQ